MILKALRAWLDHSGGREIEPWASRAALAPLEHFWHDNSPLETADRLDPSSGPGRRAPRGHIQQTFKETAKRAGQLFALEALARFLAPPAMRRFGPAFIPHLTGLIALNARGQTPEAEADFQRHMWQATGNYAFFRDYGRALLRHGLTAEFETALDQALSRAASPNQALALLELQAAAGDWELTAGHLDRLEARYPALGSSGWFRLLRHRAGLSLAPRELQPMHDFAAYRISLDPGSAACRHSAAQTDRLGLAAEPFVGVEGRRLPLALLAHLGEGEKAPTRRLEDRGHLGCSLSHLSLWEHFLDDGRPYALILEEDAVPYYRFDLGRVRPLLESGREVIYVNERRSWVNLAQNVHNFSSEAMPAVLKLSVLFEADYEAYGGDGYVLSRPGAEKLLDAHRQDGLADYLDAQMPAYSLKRPASHIHWWKRRVNALHLRLNERGGLNLNGACLGLPLVVENGFFVSGTSPARNYMAFQL